MAQTLIIKWQSGLPLASVSSKADDQAFPGGTHRLRGNGAQVVNLDDATELGKEAVEQAKISLGDPDEFRRALPMCQIIFKNSAI